MENIFEKSENSQFEKLVKLEQNAHAEVEQLQRELEDAKLKWASLLKERMRVQLELSKTNQD